MKKLGIFLSVIVLIGTIVVFIITCTQFQEVPETSNAIYAAAHDAAVRANAQITGELIFKTIVGISLSFILFFMSSNLEEIINSIKNNKVIINKVSEENSKIESKLSDLTESKALSNKSDKSELNTRNVDIIEKESKVNVQESENKAMKKQDINVYSGMKSELIDTNKDYITPIPRNGESIYWNNHVRGEVVTLDNSVDGVPAKSIGRVLGITKDMHIDVQFEDENGNVKIISVFNNNITVKEN